MRPLRPCPWGVVRLERQSAGRLGGNELHHRGRGLFRSRDGAVFMNVSVDLVSDAFYVENDPDLWKAKHWADAWCRVRVIETPVGAYGALDGQFGTTYFDVGDWLLKVGMFRQIIVVGKNVIQALEEPIEEGDDD